MTTKSPNHIVRALTANAPGVFKCGIAHTNDGPYPVTYVHNFETGSNYVAKNGGSLCCTACNTEVEAKGRTCEVIDRQTKRVIRTVNGVALFCPECENEPSTTGEPILVDGKKEKPKPTSRRAKGDATQGKKTDRSQLDNTSGRESSAILFMPINSMLRTFHSQI